MNTNEVMNTTWTYGDQDVFKTNIFIVAYTLVRPKKYFAKNLELCVPRNLLFSTAASATELQFGGF